MPPTSLLGRLPSRRPWSDRPTIHLVPFPTEQGCRNRHKFPWTLGSGHIRLREGQKVLYHDLSVSILVSTFGERSAMNFLRMRCTIVSIALPLLQRDNQIDLPKPSTLHSAMMECTQQSACCSDSRRKRGQVRPGQT